MNSKVVPLITLLLGLILLFSATLSSASDWSRSYTVVFKEPVAIPGQILPAGMYVFKLLDGDTNSHIIQIWNAEQTRIVATRLSTIASVMENAPAENLILFENRGKDGPPAIKAWFHPGKSYGDEFAYTSRK